MTTALPQAHAAPKHRGMVSEGPVTRLPLPRFVSLQANEANARTGPGYRYPIRFKFVRRHLPVEVVDEFEHWRKIRDWQGDEGWVHRRLLTGERYLRVQQDESKLHVRKDPNSPPLAYLGTGVLARIIDCEPQWCRVIANGRTGWVESAQAFGTYVNESWNQD